METETEQHMTVAEIALMREIVKWRRANGITFFRAERNTLGDFITWSAGGVWAHRTRRVSVDYPLGNEARATQMVATAPDGPELTIGPEWSLTQAVDVLVALGFLPPRFSSAYRAGWDNAMDAEHVGPSYGEVPAGC